MGKEFLLKKQKFYLNLDDFLQKCVKCEDEGVQGVQDGMEGKWSS